MKLISQKIEEQKGLGNIVASLVISAGQMQQSGAFFSFTDNVWKKKLISTEAQEGIFKFFSSLSTLGNYC